MIKKEENGTWTVQCRISDWTGVKKQHKKRGFATKREATEYEHKIMSTEPEINKTLGEFIEIYYQDKRNEVKERTLMTKKDIINKHVLPYFGNKPINSITPKEIIDWQNELISKGYLQTFLRTVANQVTAIFSHACKIYDLKENPCKKVKKMGKSDANRIDFWIIGEYEKFISYLKEDVMYYPLFETLYYTGMREGELLALTQSDIDFNSNIIHITKTYYRRNKKDYITVPKTEQSVRDIVIPNFLADELKTYISKLFGITSEQRIFPIVAEAIQHKMKRYIEIAGVPKIRVHSLRHSHVAYLINQRVEPLLIKERLGHKDIRMTLNTYGHLYPSKQSAIVDVLNRTRNIKEPAALSTSVGAEDEQPIM